MTPPDEDLAGALRALADEQPDAPHLFDVVAADRLRVVGRRRARLVTGLAAAAVVVVAGTFLGWAGTARDTFTTVPATVTSSPTPSPSVDDLLPRRLAPSPVPPGLAPTTDAGWFALCGGAPRPLGAVAGPALVVVCEEVVEPVAGDGEWAQQVVLRAGGDAAPLLALLRRPDDTGACRGVGYVAPTVAVVTAGGATVARWPDLCWTGDTLPPHELEVADLVEVARRPVRQVRTQAEVDAATAAAASGCPDTFKDMAAVGLADGGTASGAPAPAALEPWPTGSVVTACVMTVSDRLGDPGLPVGLFEKAATLDAQGAAAVVGELGGSTPSDGSCTRPATRFVVLQAGDRTGGWLLVQLDGCRAVNVTGAAGGGTYLASQALGTTLARLLGP